MAAFAQLLPIFVNTVLPVFVVAAAGFVLAGLVQIDSRSIGRVLFYLATPSLVFRSLYLTQLNAATLRHLVVIVVTVVAFSALLGWLVSIGQGRAERAALVLTSAVSNNGNMGIPIAYFAFGDIGTALATIYYVIMSFMSNSLGAMVASAGKASLVDALKVSLRTPVLYAATIGLLLNWLGGVVPLALMRGVDLMANAAIPGMLILLGIQLRSAPIFAGQAVIVRSVAVRLLAAPALAALLCLLLNVSGVERSIIILQAAMPTAVMTAVLATEFDAAPQLVATIIFLSTAASMVTLSVVLWLVM
jgi:predicted permease